jgi:hypothetical protein
MAEFSLEKTIKEGIEQAMKEPIADGKSITEWAAIGMKAPRWISVKDRLPEMHNSIFAPWHGSEKWTKAMWREESDRMIVAILFPDGSRGVGTARLHDGKWQTDIISRTLKPTVTHWLPMPEPPKEVSVDERATD